MKAELAVVSDDGASGKPRRRRRSRPAAIAPNRQPVDLGLSDYVLLGVPVLVFTFAHLFGGAAEPTTALWFTAIIALLLPAAVFFGERRSEVSLIWPGQLAAILFLLVILVAIWTLVAPAGGASTPWAAINGPGAITWDKSSTTIEIVKLCALASLFGLGCFDGVRRRRVTAALRVILVLGAAWAAVGVIVMLGGFSDVLTGLHFNYGGRLSGGFLSANSAATVYGVLLVLCVAMLARAVRNLRLGRSPQRTLALAAAIGGVLLFTTCLLSTASRMGVTATAIAVAAFLIWESLSRKEIPSRRLILLTLAGAAVAALVIGGADTLWTRLESVDSDSATRNVIFSVHWNAFLQSPLFGHGLGSFSAINAQQMTPENFSALRTIGATHNVYIQWLEEAGVLGALPMFALIALIISTAIRRAALQDTSATLQRGLIAASLVLLIHGTTDYAIQVPSIAAFWAYLLGLQFTYGKARAGKTSG
jgi:O-antigen ligase